jgi:hypothetical protein
MTHQARFRLTTWIALADFFTAISLFMFSLYAVQRHKVVVIEEPVKDFVAELHLQLELAKVPHEWDPRQAWLALPADLFLFESRKWEIRDPDKVRVLADCLIAALRGSRPKDETKKQPAFRLYLMIRGHADARPMTGITNMELSKRRSRALEEALMGFGVSAPGFQVSSQGVGDSEPKVDNCADSSSAGGRPFRLPPCPHGQYASDEQLRDNRRIELRFGIFAAK